MAHAVRHSHRLPVRLSASLWNAALTTPLAAQSTQLQQFGTASRSGTAKEEPYQLHWPPSSEALAANPVLAHVLRSAAKTARAELPANLQKLLKRQPGTMLSRQDLQGLKDVDVVNQLHLLGEQVAGPRSQLLDSLYSILEKLQPKAALQDTSAREPSEPAERDHSVRPSMEEQTAEYARVASPMEVADMLVAAKTDDVCILDVSSLCSFTEHMVLATGRSHRHIQAAAQAVAHQISLRCSEVAPGIRPSVEGQDGADWCVVDAGSIIVHVFSQDARGLYDLDSLWKEGNNMTRIEPAHQTTNTLQTIDVDTSYHLSHM